MSNHKDSQEGIFIGGSRTPPIEGTEPAASRPARRSSA